MSVSERENIHTLFLGKNYLELYKTQSKALQAMLFVETQKEFEDFLKNEERLEDYVDIDDMDNLQEKMDILNQHLSEYVYHVQIESEDTYCALAYFLMLKQK